MIKTQIIYYLFFLFFVGACAKDDPAQVDSGDDSDVEDTTYIPKPRPDMLITLADPTIFYDTATDLYYLYGTAGSDVVHTGFKVFTSKDLEDWKPHTALALTKGDAYGTDDFWAPQVFKYNGEYYMAYTANQHIAIAKSDSPLGPFKQDNKTPISDPDGVGTIDPYVFIADNGDKYLYYVRFKNGNRLYSAKLNDDLTDIDQLTVTSCINTVDQGQAWESVQSNISVTEGPTVVEHNGLYYFLYSANHFENPNYAVGYATSESLDGPWVKYADNPVIYKDLIGKNGPGHGDLFKDKNGQYYYVFHTHFSSTSIQPRLTAIIKGEFVSDGSGEDVLEFDKDSFRYLIVKQDK